MKRFALTSAWLASLVIAYYMGAMGSSMRTLFGPRIESDSAVRKLITDAGISIPEDASHLFYLGMGFEEPMIFIGMELSAEARDTITTNWMKGPESEWKPIPQDRLIDYDPTRLVLEQSDQERGDAAFYSIESFNSPKAFSYTTDEYEWENVVVFEGDGRKTLLFSWHE